MDGSNNDKKNKPSHQSEFRRIIEGISQKFIRLRAGKHESMETVAQDCGLTRGTVFKTEHPGDTEDLSLATIWAIAKHFNMSLSQLFSEIEKSVALQSEPLSPPSIFARLEPSDDLALNLIDEVTALQIRADLAEAACLKTTSEQQLEILSAHSSRLRLKRYQLLSQKKSSTAVEKDAV